jgi:hypothetical protein
MKCLGPVELDTASLQNVFHFLSANELVLSVKPLNKHFREHVNTVIEGKASKVDASADVPSWALASLGVTSLTYLQKKQLMAAAAKGGCLQTLQWARGQGCPWDVSVSRAAAEKGHPAVLQWLWQRGCPWGKSTGIAARGGHLKVLQWALQSDCPDTTYVCNLAAASGKLELLQCARSYGCSWNSPTCAAAAGTGNLPMLQWAREKGCPWGAGTCREAAKGSADQSDS